MTVAESGGIFVSYRRQESSHLAGRLYDRLADRFGERQVFIDVDTIEPGVDFAEEIFRAVAACQVLLAIIGPHWLTAADERGGRRLDDPDDIVRLEIEAALARDVRVIPLLIEGAVMPRQGALPESLAGLTRRNALLIRHESFRSDVGRLITAIERVLAPVLSGTAVSSAPDAHDVRPAGDVFGDAARKGSEPSRTDPARAARLFTEAERIVQSITDLNMKATMLGGLAEAAAAVDPNRAFRLFADAESIVQSIPDPDQKAWRLTEFVVMVVSIDADRAERIVQSITDPYERQLALGGIAAAVAATNPDRAERIARSIPDESQKASALSRIALALAATDLDRAERIAQSITDADKKQLAVSKVAAVEATDSDPDRAERIIRSIPDTYWKASALGGVAAAVAATDPDRAERIARSIPDESQKASALSGIAQALAATDPDRADRLLTDAERIVYSIPNESTRAGALIRIAAALVATSS
jgi:hypothetical protein